MLAGKRVKCIYTWYEHVDSECSRRRPKVSSTIRVLGSPGLAVRAGKTRGGRGSFVQPGGAAGCFLSPGCFLCLVFSN